MDHGLNPHHIEKLHQQLISHNSLQTHRSVAKSVPCLLIYEENMNYITAGQEILDCSNVNPQRNVTLQIRTFFCSQEQNRRFETIEENEVHSL
ncbi:hypothetical protein AVEN_153780-1 [Araneus ventricosus]|uniref:Uncharacterized protein n=1 Tax=Araneus ventricosus TaxID=182803 RepID=A0A4Y2JU34_ARAVE|nr:hypothetical protein AVEN_153780-1 [Araneus ventricosus]